MTSLEDVLAKRLEGLTPYRPGAAVSGAPSGKLSSNESPFGPAPAVRRAIAAAACGANRYPDEARALAALSGHLALPLEQVLLTNGSDELCSLVATLLLGPGTSAVLGDPCYAIDASASLLAGASLVRVPLAGGGHDLAAMARGCAGASVCWLPSPHNPTGVAVSSGELARFLDAVPADCLVVLDEAYRAFCAPERRPDVAALLERHANLLVQRTFSKDAALAGLRLGYGIAAAPLVAALRQVRAPFSVSSPALAALEAALSAPSAPSWQELTVQRVLAERAMLEAELDALCIEHYPSEANFVTARIDHARLAPYLASAGVAVRPGEDLGLPGFVRISVGWAPAMAQLRAALRQMAGEAGPMSKEQR